MQFRFAPPHGLRYTCISRRTRATGNAFEDTEIEEAGEIRAMEFGYRFIVSPRRFSCTFNGEPIDAGLSQMVLSMITIYHVDQNGRLFYVTGSSVTEEIN